MEAGEHKRKNVTVILAFLIPLVFLGVVIGLVYVPSLTLSTDYDFVYSSCGDFDRYSYYNCNIYLGNKFAVEDEHLVEKEIDPTLDLDRDKIPDTQENINVRLFLHNTEQNESREVTLEEAKELTLNSLVTSPDGVSVSSDWDRGAEFFLFFDTGSSHGYYLTKGNKKRKLNLINAGEGYYYRDNFRFIGWIIE